MDSLSLIRKRILREKSPLLYDSELSAERFAREWSAHESEWWVDGEGWLNGRNPHNAAGMAILRKPFPGNVMVSCLGRTVHPSTHDINLMWNGEWLANENKRGVAYVAGIQGWWEGKVGIEKSPDYKLTATTPLFPFEPGRTYLIEAGSVDGHCFVAIDKKLALECTDPDPIDNSRFTRIGFECYCSQIQIRQIQVRQIAWEPVDMRYECEF